MHQDIHPLLQAALTPVDKDYAAMAGDPKTRIEERPSPWLKHGGIYRVEYPSPRKPVLFFVGLDAHHTAYLMTGHPEKYAQLARAEAVKITSAPEAAAYGATYLEVTRSMAEVFYLVSSPKDVKFRPNLTGEDAQARDSFVEKYQSVLAAPVAQPSGHRYAVTAYAIRGMALEKYALSVGHDGAVSADAKVVEADLPLVYGL